MTHFEIDGKPRPFLFGLSAATPILEVVYQEGASEKELILGITKKAAHVAYLAFLAGAKAEKIEVDFTEDDVSTWIDSDFEIFQKITEEINTFISQMGQKKSTSNPSLSARSVARKKSKAKKQPAE